MRTSSRTNFIRLAAGVPLRFKYVLQYGVIPVRDKARPGLVVVNPVIHELRVGEIGGHIDDEHP